jgi:hypothetical protein
MATKTTTKPKKSSKTAAKPKKATKPAAKSKSARTAKARPSRSASEWAAKLVRSGPTFAYMRAPGVEHVFEVGDTVEVFCDHEKNNDRIRGWIKGIVVQVDNKMVAVQFRSNVFLTDGWMVPDRILWYPLTSDQIRATGAKKAAAAKKDFIPDY